MRKEALLSLTGGEIDEYAALLGIDTTRLRAKAAKVERIEKARQRTADIEVLGLTLTVPIKKMHDKRITDRMSLGTLSDSQLDELMADLLGEGQMSKVYEHCTDDDGTIDVEAVALVYSTIMKADELKNF